MRARITLLGQSHRRLVLNLQACSDEWILILGSHTTDLPALAEAGFATRHPQALYEAEPALALSHEPLTAVPLGAVNVDGHLHEGTEPTRRYVNVAVERWSCEPVPIAGRRQSTRALEVKTMDAAWDRRSCSSPGGTLRATGRAQRDEREAADRVATSIELGEHGA